MDPRREFWQEELEGYTLSLLNEAATTAEVSLDVDRETKIQLILDAACSCPDSGGLWTAIRRSLKPSNQARLEKREQDRFAKRQAAAQAKQDRLVKCQAAAQAKQDCLEKREQDRVAKRQARPAKQDWLEKRKQDWRVKRQAAARAKQDRLEKRQAMRLAKRQAVARAKRERLEKRVAKYQAEQAKQERLAKLNAAPPPDHPIIVLQKFKAASRNNYDRYHNAATKIKRRVALLREDFELQPAPKRRRCTRCRPATYLVNGRCEVCE